MTRFAQLCSSLLFALMGVVSVMPANAQDKFPSKPIRMIVPFSAGGVGDIIARNISAQLTKVLRQPVIVDNRAGGSGIVGTVYAAQQPGDGYTVLQYASSQALNEVLRQNVPYNLLRDFTPVSFGFDAPMALIVPLSSSNRSVKDLVAYAKSRPQGVAFGHGGSGSLGHLAGELFKRVAGIDAVSVGYKSTGPAMEDLMAGRLDYFFVAMPDAMTHLKGGRVVALAVTSPQRDAALPSVPTMAEAGFKDFTPTVSWGYMVPNATPAAIVAQLETAIATAIADPQFQERLAALGANSKNTGGGAVLAARIKSEKALWEPVIKSANIQPD